MGSSRWSARQPRRDRAGKVGRHSHMTSALSLPLGRKSKEGCKSSWNGVRAHGRPMWLVPGLAGVIALVTPERRRGGGRHRREKEWFLEGMGHTHFTPISFAPRIKEEFHNWSVVSSTDREGKIHLWCSSRFSRSMLIKMDS